MEILRQYIKKLVNGKGTTDSKGPGSLSSPANDMPYTGQKVIKEAVNGRPEEQLPLNGSSTEKLINGALESTESPQKDSAINRAKEVSEERVEHDTVSDKQNHGASILTGKDSNPWFVVGASVTGNGHLSKDVPCQDAHKIEFWEKGWGIAVVSDGAGSSAKSHVSAALVVEESAKQALSIVKASKWMESGSFPGRLEWDAKAIKIINGVQDTLFRFSKDAGIHLSELHATLIMLVFSPMGLLVAHIGDGRAGCLTESGTWKAVITPYEGEQVGETVFLTMDINRYPGILGTQIINEPIDSFFLLSDGCERVCWETLIFIEDTKRYKKINKPFEPFFRHTIQTFKELKNKEIEENIMKLWYEYLLHGHKKFETETDDKTLVIGIREIQEQTKLK